MRKLFSNGAMIFAGMVSLPAIVTTVDVKLPQLPYLQTALDNAAGLTVDPRLLLLQRFFETTDAPAKVYSGVFLSESDRYDLDWRLLPSISFVETTGGKAARNNNLFGWDNGRSRFNSMVEGIRTVAYSLANLSPYKDKDLDDILEAYNPNPEYSRRVKTVMNRISPLE
jgi:hypothetical protein